MLTLATTIAASFAGMTMSTIDAGARAAVRKGGWHDAAPEGLYRVVALPPSTRGTHHRRQILLAAIEGLRIICLRLWKGHLRQRRRSSGRSVEGHLARMSTVGPTTTMSCIASRVIVDAHALSSRR